ncbi:radical SAM family heme chaperone HemW [Desulfoluna spongiiphila]|uniref:radical SAM family heme chaperone HemW n=1 Tax=Desulfoluna spongiiphila TaxID=419481 RepID=UPI001252E7A5|nr:radical SAM family heme chaperone HemW [Desulfoluna spongiiphila]VVS94024.1 radical sam alpha/beta horseshoe [Desulfoluna spongiiphila]
MNPGLYIHVPFCIRKCPYCDFYSESSLAQKKAYLDGIVREMDLVARDLSVCAAFDTVYFGGGTPSLLKPGEVAGLLEAARSRFTFAPDVEVTLEVNPGTVTPSKLAGFKQAGVNRLNIGVQSLDDGTLTFLGRLHNAREAEAVLKEARGCGFSNIGADLIYGVPGQDMASVHADVAALLAHAPEHLSCYMLTLEAGTPLYVRHGKRDFSMPGDTEQGAFFGAVSDALTEGGYLHYEVSNFARGKQYVSRHNTKYWEMATTVGLGPSAHGFYTEGEGHEHPFRWWNVAHLGNWLDCLDRGERPLGGKEALDREALMTEALYLGLRRMEGVSLAVFQDRFSLDLKAVLGSVMNGFEDEGLMVADAESIRLTRKGFAVADGIVLRLLQAL